MWLMFIVEDFFLFFNEIILREFCFDGIGEGMGVMWGGVVLLEEMIILDFFMVIIVVVLKVFVVLFFGWKRIIWSFGVYMIYSIVYFELSIFM